MANVEQLEAWSMEAAQSLSEKGGKNTQVIVGVLASDGKFYVATIGAPLGLIYLNELSNRSVKERVLPKTTLSTKEEPPKPPEGGG